MRRQANHRGSWHGCGDCNENPRVFVNQTGVERLDSHERKQLRCVESPDDGVVLGGHAHRRSLDRLSRNRSSGGGNCCRDPRRLNRANESNKCIERGQPRGSWCWRKYWHVAEKRHVDHIVCRTPTDCTMSRRGQLAGQLEVTDRVDRTKASSCVASIATQHTQPGHLDLPAARTIDLPAGRGGTYEQKLPALASHLVRSCRHADQYSHFAWLQRQTADCRGITNNVSHLTVVLLRI